MKEREDEEAHRFTDKDKESLRLVLVSILKHKTEKDRLVADTRMDKARASLKEAFPESEDETLAKFTYNVAFMLASFKAMNVQELSDSLLAMFETYVLVTAAYIGEYNSSYEEEDVAKLMEELRQSKEKRSSGDESNPYIGQYL